MLHENRIGSVITRWGNNQLPPSMTEIGGALVYAGVGFGPYYSHAGRGVNPICVDTDFQSGGPDRAPHHYSYLYATHVRDYHGQTGFAADRHLKCAVCAIQ